MKLNLKLNRRHYFSIHAQNFKQKVTYNLHNLVNYMVAILKCIVRRIDFIITLNVKASKILGQQRILCITELGNVSFRICILLSLYSKHTFNDFTVSEF